jgi:hypothetical protein
VIFAAIPLIGTIGLIDDVGKPAGRVVVVVVLVVVEVVVGTGAEVVGVTVVDTNVESFVPKSLEQAETKRATPTDITRKTPRMVKICELRAKLSRFTLCTLEE